MVQDIAPRETADSPKAQPKVWAFALLGSSRGSFRASGQRQRRRAHAEE
jgi:hypothetical protein